MPGSDGHTYILFALQEKVRVKVQQLRLDLDRLENLCKFLQERLDEVNELSCLCTFTLHNIIL